MDTSEFAGKKQSEDGEDNKVVSGEYVLHTLVAEFTVQVERKVDALLGTDLLNLGNDAALSKDRLAKSLQRGEDPQFDQLLSSLGCVAEHCLPSLLDTLFKWYEHQLPNMKKNTTTDNHATEGKFHKSSTKSKSDGNQVHEDVRTKCREMAVEFVFCLVLIEVLKQLPVHPLPDSQIRSILTYAFNSFHRCGQQKCSEPINLRIVADLYAEALGVLAQTKFQAVRSKFMYELLKDKEAQTEMILSLIMGMKFFRVKMYPVEDFEASFRFLQELANYFLDIKSREVKHALAGLLVEILVPVAAAVKTEVNVPVLRDFVDSLYPTCLELSKRQKNKLAMYPLVTCLLCVSQKQFFLNNWHIFLDNCLSTLKSRDQKLSRVALESLYRMLWVYIVRIKCESNTATQSRLQSIVKSLFPVGSRNVVPKDTPLNIFVKIIQFIAQERLDFAMKEIILDLLSISMSTSRSSKPMTVHPERMNIGLRAFLVITDSLQQKDGAPPMPSTLGVMPSGNTLRVKKTFLNKTLTEDEARTIGVSHYHKHVQKALDGILQSLDYQVGSRMMVTNSQLTNKDLQDLAGEHKPKVELFRTCVAAIPRLMPTGMSHSDILDMLSRLTVHVDDELRGRAFSALQSFAVDFPTLREDVVATFLSFVLKQVSDIHHVLLDGSLKMLASLITAWKNNISNSGSNGGIPSARFRHKGSANAGFPNNNSFANLSNGKCIYAPIINRVEGFALVLLCSSRSMTRKLACHILKEIRLLAQSLEYGKQDDALCLDVLDRFCPEVAKAVIVQQDVLQSLDPSERDLVLTVASRQDMSSLVECSSNWHQHEGVHPWIMFMAAFIDTNRLPKHCPTALSYSWPDVYIRLSQIQQHIDPGINAGNKKVAPPPTNDQSLMLWTNYLVFACKCAPSNNSIKLKQTQESAIAAGTPDWRVALTRDSERTTALPSSLFQRLITQLRAEGNTVYREAAVIGLGSTSVVAFSDLITELRTLVHEATEVKKQENMRRKRKRENVRVVLAKVLSRLAKHKVLSEGILAELKDSRGSSPTSCTTIIQDYIEDMRSLLESANRVENASAQAGQATTQANSAFAGSFSSTNSQSPSVGSTFFYGTMNELRVYFCEMIIQLIRHCPLDWRSHLLPAETRKQLFHLFGDWCGKLGVEQNHASSKLSDSPDLFQAALCAECAVLCCGPVFDKKGFQKNGYLLEWLEKLLDCPDQKVHSVGWEAVVLLLHFNSNVPDFLFWLVDKCYTGSTLVATGCFLGIAIGFANRNYVCDHVSMLCLALYKITDHDPQVSHTAGHFLVILLSRFFTNDTTEKSAGTTDNFALHHPSQNKTFTKSAAYSELHSLSQMKISEDLARTYPGITLAVLSEIFGRFPTASQVGRRHMLGFMQPWLRNVELVCLGGSMSNSKIVDTCLVNASARSSSSTHPWLPLEGWGSEKATLHVLNNLIYITILYFPSLGPELEKCWATLCNTWPRNLPSSLQYLLALQSVHSDIQLSQAVRLVFSYLARAETARVIKFLICECQIAEPVPVLLESSDEAPYYKVTQLPQELRGNNTEVVDKRNLVGNHAASRHSSSAPSKIDDVKFLSHSVGESAADCSTPDSNRSNAASREKEKALADVDNSYEDISDRKSHSVENQLDILQWNSAVQGTTCPRPLPMPDNAVTLPLHRYLVYGKIEGLLRSHVACILLSELAVQHNIRVDWQTHLPTILLSVIVNMDQTQVARVPFYCQRLLGHIMIEVCQHFAPSQVACSVISCKLDSSSHVLVSSPLSSLIQNGPGGHSLSGGGEAPTSVEIVGSTEYSISSFMQQLVASTAQSWGQEDVSPKNFWCKSADHVTSFVQQAVGVFDREIPNFNLKERLGREAIQFAIDTSSKHHANRSLQVFRALRLPLPPSMLTEIVRCLLSCIAEGNDSESQSRFIEILSTMLHACDTAPPEKEEKESRQQRSRSFTPDNWGLSTGVSSFTPTSLSSFPTSHLKHSSKIGAAQVSGLSLLPSKPKLSLSSFNKDKDNTLESAKAAAADDTSHSKAVASARPTKKGHAHRRSGSVTLSKKMAKEVTTQRSTIPPERPSPPAAPKSQPPMLLPNTESADDSVFHQEKVPVITNSEEAKGALSEAPVPTPHDVVLRSDSTDEWKSMLAQMFWIGAALLESDYEHQYLFAVQLIEKVIPRLPLHHEKDRLRIERYLGQIKWPSFPGVQTLLLKGLTSSITSDASFRLISTLTTVSHLPLVSSDHIEGIGFSMNVIALLPHLVDHFSDPDHSCLESAQNIAQVCVEDYPDKKKLQSLAHVMSLYSNQTYGKPCSTWVSVVCKYVHETFPDAIQKQLTFLMDMLEKGPATTHQSCLQIVYSLLSLSEILSTTACDGVKFNQDILRTVSKFINNTKYWKEALNILKLAVSRCSAITIPSSSGILQTSLSGDLDRLELPGRTLTFEFDIKETPIVGKIKSYDGAAKTHPSASQTHATNTTSQPTPGWKRPHFSQRRTHERILSILPICGQHQPIRSEGTLAVVSPDAYFDPHLPDDAPSVTLSDAELTSEKNGFDPDDEEQSENSGEEQRESGVDDTYVLRNFDFLDDIEDSEDRFALIQNQNSSIPAPDFEPGAAEDDPETCNLTPMHLEPIQDTDRYSFTEEESAHDSGSESESSFSLSSSVHSMYCATNEDVLDPDNASLNKSKSVHPPVQHATPGEKTGKRRSLITNSEKSLRAMEQIARRSSSESDCSESVPKSFQSPDFKVLIDRSPVVREKNNSGLVPYRAISSDTLESEDENSSVPSGSSAENFSEESRAFNAKMGLILNGKHSPLCRQYSDIPHTPPPPPSAINSEPVDIPIVSPPPADDLLSASSSTHSEPAALGASYRGSPLTQTHSVPHMARLELGRSSTTSSSRDLKSASKTKQRPLSVQSLSLLPSALSAFKLSQPDHKMTPTVSSFSNAAILLDPPWNAPSPLPEALESQWKLHIESITTGDADAPVIKTFDLFPMLYRVLCFDFSKLSKEGCKHLGSQLSKISEHFSSMVEHLPSQIQCPICLTTRGTVDPVLEQLKFELLELQEHLDSYNTKRKNTLQCLDMVKAMMSTPKKAAMSSTKSFLSTDESETVAHKARSTQTEDLAEIIDLSSSNSSASSHSPLTSPQTACTNPVIIKCQLELCRLLYKLHFQLLLLLKSFHKLIHLVTTSSPDSKNITEEIRTLQKKLFAVEIDLKEQNSQSIDESEMVFDMKSLTCDEAEQALVDSITNEHVHHAIGQLSALRHLWPPEVFGSQDDIASDCLTKIYFRHLEEKSPGKFYAVLGPDDITHGMCEKLMEVNSHIQQSLQSLAVIPQSEPVSSESVDARPTMKRTLL